MPQAYQGYQGWIDAQRQNQIAEQLAARFQSQQLPTSGTGTIGYGLTGLADLLADRGADKASDAWQQTRQQAADAEATGGWQAADAVYRASGDQQPGFLTSALNKVLGRKPEQEAAPASPLLAAMSARNAAPQMTSFNPQAQRQHPLMQALAPQQAAQAVPPAIGGPNAPSPRMAPQQPASGLGEQFAQIEQQRGLPAGYLSRLAQVESGGDPNARNTKSSAKGMFQVIDSTARQYGLTDPMDPIASAGTAADIASEALPRLTNILGRQPTPGEIYLAHQQGLGGASKLFSNPNARAADIVGADAVRLNGGSPDMTAGQFTDKWVSKFDGAAPSAPANYQYQQLDPRQSLMLQNLAASGDPLAISRLGVAADAFDPAKQQALEANAANLDYIRARTRELNNPTPDYRQLTPAEVQQRGLPAGNYQLGRDGRVQPISDPRLSGMGDAPAGYRYVTGQDGQPALVPVAGGPADQKTETALKAADNAARSAQVARAQTTDQFAKIRDLAANGTFATGLTGSLAGKVSISDAAELRRQTQALKDTFTLSTLQGMKAASPNGASGLGATSDRELGMLASQIGALDPDSSPEQFASQLDAVQSRLTALGLMDDPGTMPSATERPAGGISPRMGRYMPGTASAAPAPAPAVPAPQWGADPFSAYGGN